MMTQSCLSNISTTCGVDAPNINGLIPTYRIDLSKSPEARYEEISQVFGPRMRDLQYLWDEILHALLPSPILRWIFTILVRLLARKVFEDEEMAEIKGISKATGVKLHLLITLNTLLDCLLGCTSGAVLTQPSKRRSKGRDPQMEDVRLMHFRTLDWGMDGLRDLLVVLEFYNSSESHSRVVARSVTYAGFVGSLTAVRENLSISLNFRPNHDCSDRALWVHRLMVLMGRRKSIPSIIRSTILDSQPHVVGHAQSNFHKEAERLASLRTSPCYLILCNGSEAAVIEKDLTDGHVQTAKNFIVCTNHDASPRPNSAPEVYAASSPLGHEEWLEESIDRKECLEKKWQRLQKKHRSKDNTLGEEQSNSVYPVDEPTLKRWVGSNPITEGCTHFACVMDPQTTQIRWIRRGPVTQDY